MKRIMSTTHSPSILNLWLLLFRILIASFMLTHGYGKLQMLLAGGEITFADPLGIGMGLSLFLVVFAEFFCSILLGIGLFTRLAAIPLIVNMSVAAFIFHSEDPFAKKELAFLYLFIYVTLLVLGGGKFSVDAVLAGRRRQ